jgi:hypothetical protein
MKLFLLAGMCICLNGCALTLEMMAISGISYLATGKSVSDNAFSLLTKQDCALHRMMLGESLCEKKPAILDETIPTLTASTELRDTATPQTSPPETSPAQTAGEKQGETGHAHISKPVVMTKTMAVQAFAMQSELDKAWHSEPERENPAVALNINAFLLPVEENSPLADQDHLAAKFAVVGSFNSYQYAQHRNEKYLAYNAHIIQNPNNYPTKYRVVVGPLKHATFSIELPVLVGAETLLPWKIDLCVNDMSPPPCLSNAHNTTFAVVLNQPAN